MNTVTKFIGSLVFLVLFSLAIIGFALNFANDTSADITIADDTNLMEFRTDGEASMDSYNSESSSTFESILESTVEPGSETYSSSAPITITFRNVFDIAKNIIRLPQSEIFGDSPEFAVFFVAFIGFLAFMLALLTYKALRGNP